MASAGADTQGAIGYMLQQCLTNDLRQRGIHKEVVSLVTQVVVDHEERALADPCKPIGSFMDHETAQRCRDELGWRVAAAVSFHGPTAAAAVIQVFERTTGDRT
jgi:carbamate kinase